MRVIIMGAPGAGKGTQARFIAEHLGVPAISTGDIFRNHVARGTQLGVSAQRYMDAGEYVPDEVTNGMVRARLSEPDAAQGFLLDGYPRTVAQVDELDGMLRETGHSIDLALCLSVDTEDLVERLSRRARLEGRADDTKEVIRHRQMLYAKETEPVVSIYSSRHQVRLVEGTGAIMEVTQRLICALQEPAADDGRSNVSTGTRA